MKVRALPTCRKPVGDGANRTRSITFEYSGIAVLALEARGESRGSVSRCYPENLEPPRTRSITKALASDVSACSFAFVVNGLPRLSGKSGRLPTGYEGNSSAEDGCSGIASYKKILPGDAVPRTEPAGRHLLFRSVWCDRIRPQGFHRGPIARCITLPQGWC